MICLPADLPDAAYLEKLVDRYAGLLYWAVEKCADRKEDQEDIVQDTMEKLLHNVDKIRALDADALPSYLVEMVKRTGSNYHRADKDRRENEVELAEWADKYYSSMEDPMEEAVFRKEKIKILRTVLDELPEESGELLRRKYILGMSDEELAQQFNCKPASIRMKLTRARRLARKLFLQKEEGELSEER